MRMKARRLTVWRVNGAYRLQASAELAVARVLEGRAQSIIVYGDWNLKGIVLGFYESSAGAWDAVARRATGGPSMSAETGSKYAAVIHPTTSLKSTVELAWEAGRCLGVEEVGATRVGPKALSVGVIEYIGDFTLETLIPCLNPIHREPRIAYEEPPVDRVTEIAKAYASPGWIKYAGVDGLQHVGVVEREAFKVRVGVNLYEERFIALARIDGNFYAAPPAEPYSSIVGIQGMPLNDQVLLALDARFSSGLELYGVEARDVSLAFKRAVGPLLDDE